METNTLLIIILSGILATALFAILLTWLIGQLRLNRQRRNQRSYTYSLTPRSKSLPPAFRARKPQIPTVHAQSIQSGEGDTLVITDAQPMAAKSLAEPIASISTAQPPVFQTSHPINPIKVEVEIAPHVEAPTQTVAAPMPMMTRVVSYFDLNRKQRTALRKQAQIDYEQARGSAHQRILADSRKRIEQEKQKQEKQIQDIQRQLDIANSTHQAELRRTLEQHIINTRFVEVDGIGNSLQTRIFDAIHPKSFADLRLASTVPGVGENRMAAIEAWISRCNQQMPQLLMQSFPGSDEINQRFMAQKNSLQKNREQAQATLTVLGKKIAEIDQHLSWLNVISIQTYVEASEGKTEAQAQVARHTIGVFPEWEPIPTWFKKILDGKDIV